MKYIPVVGQRGALMTGLFLHVMCFLLSATAIHPSSQSFPMEMSVGPC